MSLKDRLNKVLDRIDDLSSKLELTEKEKKEMIEDPIASQIEELLDEPEAEAQDAPGDPETTAAPERVDLSWEDVSDIVSLRDASEKIRLALSELCVEFEIQKRNMLNSLERVETELAKQISATRSAKNIPENVQYNLRLPEEPGGSGELILRKE